MRRLRDALPLIALGLAIGALILACVRERNAYMPRKATSTTTVWAYYGGVGWATDESIACESAVLVDQQTGVMYLMTKTKNDVDVTVLLNADGTPRKQVE